MHFLYNANGYWSFMITFREKKTPCFYYFLKPWFALSELWTIEYAWWFIKSDFHWISYTHHTWFDHQSCHFQHQGTKGEQRSSQLTLEHTDLATSWTLKLMPIRDPHMYTVCSDCMSIKTKQNAYQHTKRCWLKNLAFYSAWCECVLDICKQYVLVLHYEQTTLFQCYTFEYHP